MLVATQITHLHSAMPMPMSTHDKTRQWQGLQVSPPSSLPFSYASTAASSSFSHSVVTKTLDEALDLEALALSAGSDYEDTCRSSYSSSSGSCGAGVPGSGLPLVCSNCGVSFFSLQIADDELECYCSGECKWSVIMYREMDHRMRALRRHVHAAADVNTVTATVKTVGERGAVARKSAGAAVSVTRSSVATASTTADTVSESYSHHYMDDVISCR
jgi:hypothetical protein